MSVISSEDGIHGCDAASLRDGLWLLAQASCYQERITPVSLAEVKVLGNVQRAEMRGIAFHLDEVVHHLDGVRLAVA